MICTRWATGPFLLADTMSETLLVLILAAYTLMGLLLILILGLTLFSLMMVRCSMRCLPRFRLLRQSMDYSGAAIGLDTRIQCTSLWHMEEENNGYSQAS